MDLTKRDHDLPLVSPRALDARWGQAALLALLPALLVLEWTSGSPFSITLLYLLPVALAAWHFGYRWGFGIAGVASGYCIFVALSMHPAGTPLAPVLWQSAMTLGMYGVFAWGVAHHRRFLERVLAHSRVDAETGAWAPREFNRVLETEVRRAKRYSHPLTVVMIESNAAAKSQSALRKVATDTVDTLRANIREGDAVARLGPRKFALLLLECPAPEAMAVASRTLDAVERRFDRRVPFCFSVASYVGESPTTASQVLQRAERRLDMARAAGGRGIEQVVFA